MKTGKRKIAARWVVPISSAPIENGYVEIENDSIVSVGPVGVSSVDLDLGDVAIFPGWVNCHTHLEFSDLQTPLGSPGIPITDWIPMVVGDRVAKATGGQSSTDAIRKGLGECWETGTVCVGEIATNVDDLSPYLESELCGTLFYERLGNDPEISSERVESCRRFLSENKTGSSGWKSAISPHASYSVSEPLLNGLVELASHFNVAVAMHLAESRQELEWMADRSGEFSSLLHQLNAPSHHQKESLRFENLFASLQQACRALLIHGNYFSDRDLDWISSKDQFGIIFCPRTHDFFGHDAYPLSKIMDRGIAFGLGTDSRASNPDLDLLAEARHVYQAHSNLNAKTVFEWITIGGAELLGFSERFGSLEPAKSARLAMVDCSADKNPQEWILENAETVAKPVSSMF